MPYHFPPNPFVNGQWGVIGNWEAITTLDDSAVFWFLFAEGDSYPGLPPEDSDQGYYSRGLVVP